MWLVATTFLAAGWRRISIPTSTTTTATTATTTAAGWVVSTTTADWWAPAALTTLTTAVLAALACILSFHEVQHARGIVPLLLLETCR